MKKLKKFLAVAAACAALTGLLAVSASAHGGHHNRTQANYPTCTVTSCTETGTHTHNGATYCGHTYGGCGGHQRSGHHGGHC